MKYLFFIDQFHFKGLVHWNDGSTSSDVLRYGTGEKTGCVFSIEADMSAGSCTVLRAAICKITTGNISLKIYPYLFSLICFIYM